MRRYLCSALVGAPSRGIMRTSEFRPSLSARILVLMTLLWFLLEFLVTPRYDLGQDHAC